MGNSDRRWREGVLGKSVDEGLEGGTEEHGEKVVMRSAEPEPETGQGWGLGELVRVVGRQWGGRFST